MDWKSLTFITNNNEKNEFGRAGGTFGRSPNATNGDFLDPISSEFNADSNAHIHLAWNWWESAKKRDLSQFRQNKLEIRTRNTLGLSGEFYY